MRRKATCYTHSNGGKRHGRVRGPFGQGQDGRGLTYENYSQFWSQDASHRGTFRRRRSFHSGPNRQNAIECGYCGNSATTKKSAERRSVNQLPKTDNSRITRIILTTKIIAERTGTTPTTKIVAECTHTTPIVAECS